MAVRGKAFGSFSLALPVGVADCAMLTVPVKMAAADGLRLRDLYRHGIVLAIYCSTSWRWIIIEPRCVRRGGDCPYWALNQIAKDAAAWLTGLRSPGGVNGESALR